MGWVYTIMFDFCHKPQIATVTVVEESSGKARDTVRLFNEELHRPMPKGTFCFTSSGDVMPSWLQREEAAGW